MKENIIFYFSDQQRYDTVNSEIMPNLMSLAEDGTFFENCYTSQPVCGPARACLQTGVYPTECGCYINGIPLKDDTKSLADYFNENGQKWGNPVYSVEYMREDNYKYLIRRFKYMLKMFDKIRVDYFRGYDSFFRIPIGKSGKEGFYADGVSYAFFDELLKNEEVKIVNHAEEQVVAEKVEVKEKSISKAH